MFVVCERCMMIVNCRAVHCPMKWYFVCFFVERNSRSLATRKGGHWPKHVCQEPSDFCTCRYLFNCCKRLSQPKVWHSMIVWYVNILGNNKEKKGCKLLASLPCGALDWVIVVNACYELRNHSFGYQNKQRLNCFTLNRRSRLGESENRN